MPNAKDAHPDVKPHRIFALGDAGGGKTSQIITLPKPCFTYFFDPNGLNSIQGHDVDYEEWLAEDLPLGAFSLKKDTKGDTKKTAGSDVYNRWEQSFEQKLKDGFFNPYKTICVDSATTLLDLIMDRILTINGRPGMFPQQDDYGPQMVTFMNFMRILTGLQKTIYVTGHLRTDKDETLGRILRLPLVTGQLREKLPLLFSDVLIFSAETDPTTRKATYQIQTTPDKMTPRVRTSIKGLEPIEDVTLYFDEINPKNNSKLPFSSQGIGGILNWERRNLGLT